MDMWKLSAFQRKISGKLVFQITELEYLRNTKVKFSNFSGSRRI